MFWLPIHAFTLWDFHVLRALEHWKAGVGARVRDWLTAVADVDALSALAGLAFEEPGWCMPELVRVDGNGPPVFEARDLAHPLLPHDVRVANDVSVGPPDSFLMVTGSNMSGKTTLLRAIGANVVLAHAGGPVCARSLRMPPLRLRTSMRIEDSLEEGVSLFMAELRRLKTIVDAATECAQQGTCILLYLLDEILHGTNSAERQVAVRRVVAHLLQAGAIGAISTHDLELADAEPLRSARHPVHFQETVGDGADSPAMSFDYKLRSGIATSTNALKLVRLVGLD
jgi:DNA mismatch repair ATPase MutS